MREIHREPEICNYVLECKSKTPLCHTAVLTSVTDHWFKTHWTGSNFRLAVWAHAVSLNRPGSLSVIDPGDVAVIEAAETKIFVKSFIEIRTYGLPRFILEAVNRETLLPKFVAVLVRQRKATGRLLVHPYNACENKLSKEAILAWHTADVSVKNSVLSILDDEIV